MNICSFTRVPSCSQSFRPWSHQHCKTRKLHLVRDAKFVVHLRPTNRCGQEPPPGRTFPHHLLKRLAPRPLLCCNALQSVNAGLVRNNVRQLFEEHDGGEKTKNHGNSDDQHASKDLRFAEWRRQARRDRGLSCRLESCFSGGPPCGYATDLSYTLRRQEIIAPTRSSEGSSAQTKHGRPTLEEDVEDEEQEMLLVPRSHAVVDPRAVVIHPHDAPVADAAMMSHDRLRCLATLARRLVANCNILGQSAWVGQHARQMRHDAEKKPNLIHGKREHVANLAVWPNATCQDCHVRHRQQAVSDQNTKCATTINNAPHTTKKTANAWQDS
mmetsp:Transcript_4422/g.12509  ORF Transcript_4422/g.12509 Transcript_4422/m.12509 type:complete len:327 (-) Transcript_4422:56-1036(-)